MSEDDASRGHRYVARSTAQVTLGGWMTVLASHVNSLCALSQNPDNTATAPAEEADAAVDAAAAEEGGRWGTPRIAAAAA